MFMNRKLHDSLMLLIAGTVEAEQPKEATEEAKEGLIVCLCRRIRL